MTDDKIPPIGWFHGTYERPARSSGEIKYRPREMLRLAMTAAFSFSRLPIGLVGIAGALVSAGSLLAVGFGLPAGTGGLYFLGGIQLLGLWVIGQYVVTIAEEVRRRPLYLVRESVNLHRTSSSPANEA